MKNKNKINQVIIAMFLILISAKSLAHDHNTPEGLAQIEAHEFELLQFEQVERGCQKASSSQVSKVNQGNAQHTAFKDKCLKATANAQLCSEVERPNPESKSVFTCTYGAAQPNLLIHPSASTWKNAYKAIQLIDKLKAKGLCVKQIYNWWRPEPYNQNVGGASGRHPFGTSVDVRFCTNKDATRAFDELCKYRSRGEVRALGYYGSTGVHIGVGDSSANTWGRECD
jgi:hypothetical protein